MRVINTLIEEKQQTAALAFVATLKNLAAFVVQNIAGQVLDAAGYSYLFLLYFVCVLGALLVTGRFMNFDGGKKEAAQGDMVAT